MIDLFPKQVMVGLKAKFGARFDELSHVERVALALAASEGTVNHARLRAVTTEHSVDLSKTLQHLTHNRMLESTGGRGAIYHLSGETIPTPDDVFGPSPRISIITSSDLGNSSLVLTGSSSVLKLPSSILEADETTKRDAEGRILASKLDLPLLDDLSTLHPVFRTRLEAMAALPRTKKKLPRTQLREVLMNICRDQFVCLRALAELVDRKPDALRNEYLSPMVRESVMALAFPKTPTHERQAYRSQPRPLKAGE